MALTYEINKLNNQVQVSYKWRKLAYYINLSTKDNQEKSKYFSLSDDKELSVLVYSSAPLDDLVCCYRKLLIVRGFMSLFHKYLKDPCSHFIKQP